MSTLLQNKCIYIITFYFIVLFILQTIIKRIRNMMNFNKQYNYNSKSTDDKLYGQLVSCGGERFYKVNYN